MVIAEDILPSRYTALKLVARGGMGEVYRATDTVLERPVAVKVLSDRYARDSEARTRFKREARAAARLSGELHVITVFDVGEHEERPFIVMEYLEGGSLHDKLSAGRIEPHEALDWLGQAAGALDTAHRRGIVHRDVKPANLLLDRGGSLQVLDFGIASAAGSDALTLPGTVLGTAGYLSPEQARGEPATSASDRYALGVVAFELLTGRRPFAADTTLTEAFAHASAPIPRASAIAPTLNGDVDAVLARALAKDPSRPPQLRRARRGTSPCPGSRRCADSRRGGRASLRAPVPAAIVATARARRSRRRRRRRDRGHGTRVPQRLDSAARGHPREERGLRGGQRSIDDGRGAGDDDGPRGSQTVGAERWGERCGAERCGLWAHAGRRVRDCAPAARARGRCSARLRIADRGLCELQPGLYAPVARTLRRRPRAARPLRRGPGSAQGDRPATARVDPGMRERGRRGSEGSARAKHGKKAHGKRDQPEN